MPNSTTKIKKSHSPARKIFFEESPRNVTLSSLSNIRNRKSSKFLKTKASEIIKTEENYSTRISFKPRIVKEFFLFEPASKILLESSTPSHKRSFFTPKSSNYEIPSKAFNVFSELSEGKWKKIEILKKTESKNVKISKNFFRHIKNNNCSEVDRMLTENPELINECDSLGMNALHWAAKRNLIDLAKVLSNHKINVLTRDSLGRNATDIAIKWKSYDFLNYFSELSSKIELVRKMTINQTSKF